MTGFPLARKLTPVPAQLEVACMFAREWACGGAYGAAIGLAHCIEVYLTLSAKRFSGLQCFAMVPGGQSSRDFCQSLGLDGKEKSALLDFVSPVPAWHSRSKEQESKV